MCCGHPHEVQFLQQRVQCQFVCQLAGYPRLDEYFLSLHDPTCPARCSSSAAPLTWSPTHHIRNTGWQVSCLYKNVCRVAAAAGDQGPCSRPAVVHAPHRKAVERHIIGFLVRQSALWHYAVDPLAHVKVEQHAADRHQPGALCALAHAVWPTCTDCRAGRRSASVT